VQSSYFIKFVIRTDICTNLVCNNLINEILSEEPNTNINFNFNKVLYLFNLFNLLIYLWNGILYIQGVRKVRKRLNISKTKHFRKIFETKVVGFKMIYLLILSVWPWVALPRSDQVKVTSIFLNGIPHFWLQNLIADVESFPKHYD